MSLMTPTAFLRGAILTARDHRGGKTRPCPPVGYTLDTRIGRIVRWRKRPSVEWRMRLGKLAGISQTPCRRPRSGTQGDGGRGKICLDGWKRVKEGPVENGGSSRSTRLPRPNSTCTRTHVCNQRTEVRSRWPRRKPMPRAVQCNSSPSHIISSLATGARHTTLHKYSKRRITFQPLKLGVPVLRRSGYRLVSRRDDDALGCSYLVLHRVSAHAWDR